MQSEPSFILVLGLQNVEDRLRHEKQGEQKIQVMPSDKSHFIEKFPMNNSEENECIPGGGLMCKPFFRLHCTGKMPGLSTWHTNDRLT